MTEQLIYDVFAQAGTIQSVRLCRDSSSRKPLGYAYVNYAAPADGTESYFATLDEHVASFLSQSVAFGKMLLAMLSAMLP